MPLNKSHAAHQKIDALLALMLAEPSAFRKKSYYCQTQASMYESPNVLWPWLHWFDMMGFIKTATLHNTKPN